MSRTVLTATRVKERGRLQLRVTQQDLDHANVDALLKQMGGIR